MNDKDNFHEVMRKAANENFETSDDFYSGVISALLVVYGAGEDNLAKEIVAACGKNELLKYAIRNNESCIGKIME